MPAPVAVASLHMSIVHTLFQMRSSTTTHIVTHTFFSVPYWLLPAAARCVKLCCASWGCEEAGGVRLDHWSEMQADIDGNEAA